MALSARTPTTVDTNKFIPELFVDSVIVAAKSDLVCVAAVNNEWLSGAVKGDTYYITKTNAVTASEVVVGSKGTALNPFNTTPVTVTINQWFECPVDIDTMTKFQSHIAMETYARDEAKNGIDKRIDTYVNSLFSTLNGSTVVGADGQTLTDDLLISFKETLDENDVPQGVKVRSLIVDASGLADMLKIDKLVSADYIRMAGNIENGFIGNSVYGCAVRFTNNLTAATTGAYGCMLHKNAIASKIQFQDAWMEWYKELHQIRFQVEAIWGASEAQDAFGVPFYTRRA